jgi:hypothetical protein
MTSASMAGFDSYFDFASIGAGRVILHPALKEM